MEDLVISNKFSRDIMEDYFGFHLSATIEVLERIDDDVLELSIKNWTLPLHKINSLKTIL